MPKVTNHKKNSAGKPYACVLCDKKIKVGERYYQWSFRYGGTRRQHESHGHPKASQLTQSKVAGAYGAIESAELALAGADCVEDIAATLRDCATEIESVRDEYQESIDAMPEPLQEGPVAEEMRERIEMLEEYAENLNNGADEIEADFSETEHEPDASEEDKEAAEQQTVEDARTRADEVLGEYGF